MLSAHVLPSSTPTPAAWPCVSTLPLPRPDMAWTARTHHPAWNDALCMRVLHFPDTKVDRCKTNKRQALRARDLGRPAGVSGLEAEKRVPGHQGRVPRSAPAKYLGKQKTPQAGCNPSCDDTTSVPWIGCSFARKGVLVAFMCSDGLSWCRAFGMIGDSGGDPEGRWGAGRRIFLVASQPPGTELQDHV